MGFLNSIKKLLGSEQPEGPMEINEHSAKIGNVPTIDRVPIIVKPIDNNHSEEPTTLRLSEKTELIKQDVRSICFVYPLIFPSIKSSVNGSVK